ncbi:PorP/SprF family type IX secretion system membrane protein [Robiginitalea sp.]|uniref:PorP/SprF family type IX secretion system membrane protein n=1 Tax=Robiginitalea sp. TaxID=1902411 RepID=UPI003C742348
MKNRTQTYPILLGVLIFFVLSIPQELHSQEDTSPENFRVKSPFHNQLFFNRFLINPTFSLVRENKSYLNIMHRNQYASFEDNIQNYYLGFSNKMNERTALGIGVYGQWEGVVQEFGFNANYATSVRLGEKTLLAFGTNLTYISQGLDRNRIVAPEEDPLLQESTKQNQIAIQPGMALTVGRFDVGLYATNLIRYNQTTNELQTGFSTDNLRASLQYTHYLSATSGFFEGGRIMPMVQVGQDQLDRFAYIGSLLLDLPEYGWFQTTFDPTYGLSMGLGFNLSQRLSMGYLMEKDISEAGGNLGWNHEISLAYSIRDDKNGGHEGLVETSTDNRIDDIVRNYEEQILELRAQAGGGGEQSTAATLAWENRMILDELIWRQDSIENARNDQLERKFETLVRTIRNEIRNDDGFRKPTETLDLKSRTMQTAVAAAGSGVKETKNVPARKDFRELPIRAKNRSDVVGVTSGYYLIANVFKNKTYLNAFMDSLKQKGLNAKQFYNSENGLYYVYLAGFNDKVAAKSAFVSNLEGQYRDEKWIMEVYNPVATAEVIYQE